MSKDWVKDINDMHSKYNMHERFEKFTDEERARFLEFRVNFIQEELDEMKSAIGDSDAEEIVDALIDICVVVIGTLDAYGIDSHRAWDEVLRANMNKKPGVKDGRPNPLNLPDLIKPDGWKPPSHVGNYGRLVKDS